MVSQSILRAVDAIYTRNDLDLLLSSPLPPWTVLIVRSAAIAIGALPLYAGILGPPVIGLAVFNSPLWLSALFGLVALAFASAGVALLIVTGLFRLIGPKRTRMVAQVVSALTGAAVFLSFQYMNLSQRGQRGDSSAMAQWVSQLHIDPYAWWLAPARAMTGDILAFLGFLAVCAALFPLGVFLFSRRFVADAAAASAMGPVRRKADTRTRALRSGVMGSVVRKELRLLVRDPVLLSQIGLQLVYLLPLAFILIVPSGNSISRFTPAAIPSVLTLLASSLAGSLIWLCVSAEDSPDLIASAPVDRRIVDRAKLVAAVVPVWLLMAIPIIALGAASFEAATWATGGVLAASISSGLVGSWRRVPGSRRNFIRRRGSGSLASSLGQTFVALGCSFTVGLGAYGFPWLSIVPGILTLAVLVALHKVPPAPGEEPAVVEKPKKEKRRRDREVRA
jgi:ABC-2 type transport system permease protein